MTLWQDKNKEISALLLYYPHNVQLFFNSIVGFLVFTGGAGSYGEEKGHEVHTIISALQQEGHEFHTTTLLQWI